MKKIQKNAARFDNLKQDFLDDKKYSGTAEATLNGYRYDITRFLKFLSDEQLAVNEAGFKRYVIHLTDSGMTANSVNHYIRSVKVFLYWCMEQDEIASFKIKIKETLELYKARTITEAEYLAKMRDILEDYRTGKSAIAYPDRIRANVHNKTKINCVGR